VARIHDHRLLHRDIKPANLFLSAHEDVLVGDLGMAALWDTNGLAPAAGSLPTMAPEVAQVGVPGQIVPSPKTYGVRSEVYSLGASLFWMLAGVEPVAGGATSFEIAWSSPRIDLWEVAPHVSRGIRNVVNRSLAVDPLQRYASPSDLDAALGSLSAPSRRWIRLSAHPGHEACFEGTKGVGRIVVCAIPTGRGTQLQVVATRPDSNRRVQRAERNVPRSRMAAGLRAAFRDCG
jgi:serine/threonine-protein kinase